MDVIEGLPHPCPAPEASWWAGNSDEGPMYAGPLPSRDCAIQEALDQGDFQEIEPEGYDFSKPCNHPDNQGDWSAGVFVGKYRQRHANLAKWFDADRWVEDITDQMDDEWGADENGDNHPLDEISKDDIKALQESVRLAIWHWQNRRELKLKAYWMTLVEGGDYETMPHPENPKPHRG